MPVTALVVTLSETPTGDPLAPFRNDPRVVVGPPQGSRLPVVLETKTAREGRSLAEELEGLRDVLRVDLISVNFEDLQG